MKKKIQREGGQIDPTPSSRNRVNDNLKIFNPIMAGRGGVVVQPPLRFFFPNKLKMACIRTLKLFQHHSCEKLWQHF